MVPVTAGVLAVVAVTVGDDPAAPVRNPCTFPPASAGPPEVINPDVVVKRTGMPGTGWPPASRTVATMVAFGGGGPAITVAVKTIFAGTPVGAATLEELQAVVKRPTRTRIHPIIQL